jgi:hypothetical protein
LPLLVITSWSNGSNQKKNLLGVEEKPKQEGKDDYGCQCNKKNLKKNKLAITTSKDIIEVFLITIKKCILVCFGFH